MQTLLSQIHLPLITRIREKHPSLDMDAIDIDSSMEGNPNQIILQAEPDTLTIGQFLDALIYCLALNDIDPLEYTIQENEEHNMFTFTLLKSH